MSYFECSFLVPLRGDSGLSDGELHAVETWSRLENELFRRFEGYTWAPGSYRGVYRDPDSQVAVPDESRKCVVALSEERLPELRQLLSIAAVLFHQKMIYLSVAGRVEFIEHPHETNEEAISNFGRSTDSPR